MGRCIYSVGNQIQMMLWGAPLELGDQIYSNSKNNTEKSIRRKIPKTDTHVVDEAVDDHRTRDTALLGQLLPQRHHLRPYVRVRIAQVLLNLIN